jgi:phosphate transport system permease protein
MSAEQFIPKRPTETAGDTPEDLYDIVPDGALPQGEAMQKQIAGRRTVGSIGRRAFYSSLIIGIIALLALLYNLVNSMNGLVAREFSVAEERLAGPGNRIEDLDEATLLSLLGDNLSASQERRIARSFGLNSLDELDQVQLVEAVRVNVMKEKVVASWNMTPSLFNRSGIEQQVAEKYPDAKLEWNWWLTPRFLVVPMSSSPELAGIRTAILGSLYMILMTMLMAIPIGVGAAIYLEEYADRNTWYNRIIQTNINNLAGVPSIVYGILGLAIFVQALGYWTSGQAFGFTDNQGNGRTLISAALTITLLILPLIIINAQEAIRAVPNSLRQASYGLGATKWQTVWNQVLPVAFPGILTGTILAMSRAIGESAPLILVGASTFIITDPSGPFSKFTALPIQIFNWTARPQAEFRHIAAAASIVLLILLLSLNSLAIWLRNRYRRSI